MITISKSAAKQVKLHMEESGAEGMSLRFAVRRLQDGSLDYAMGFDETDHNDSHSRTNGVDVIVAPTSTELLRGATLDYVELEDGELDFIFINPNDASHVPPEGFNEDQSEETQRKPKAVVPDQDALNLKPAAKTLPGFKPA
jgi:iron-sulfur cluster assembly protein